MFIYLQQFMNVFLSPNDDETKWGVEKWIYVKWRNKTPTITIETQSYDPVQSTG